MLSVDGAAPLPGAHQAAKGEFPGVKVRCENWFWSRQLQLILADELDCRWDGTDRMPWNLRRPLLVIRLSPKTGRWFITWATDPDFEQCPLPEYTAKGLVHAHAARH